VTFMVIPERTRRVHKWIVPFALLRLGMVLVAIMLVVGSVLSVDYLRVLGRMAENKRLKGENFKLRQELQLIKNRVESMESTLDRVRDYAKKLQVMTGDTNHKASDLMPQGPIDVPASRRPSQMMGGEPHSDLRAPRSSRWARLANDVEGLHQEGIAMETALASIHSNLLARSSLLDATPTLLPLRGWISSGFGYRRHPYDGTLRMHSGVDIAAEPGTPIRAPADGTVIFSGYREGYGKVVVIDHGYGIRTLFAHNSKLFVNFTERIKRGAILSEVGSTGHSTGPHLHYEIRKNGVPINPITFHSRPRF